MSNKRIGFIVAGYTTDECTPDTARKIEVLAVSELEALEAVVEAYPDLNPVGVMSEDQIKADLAEIEALREVGKFGFMVCGYVGESLLPETARTLPIWGRDSDEAKSASMEIIDDLKIVGVMSEYQLRMDLDLIDSFKKQHENQ